MLLQKLKEHFGANQPIFIQDAASFLQISATSTRQMLKRWADSGAMLKLDRGIYYFPGESRFFGTMHLNPDTVIRQKYLGKPECPIGYYTGLVLANSAGITTQMTSIPTIVTNAESSRMRKVKIKDSVICLKAPKTEITKENIGALSFLDLLLISSKYSEFNAEETSVLLSEFAKKMNVTKEAVKENLSFFPQKTSQLLIGMEVYDVLA